MIKVYSKEELNKEIYEDDVIWSYPIDNLSRLLEEHNNGEFILCKERLYEKDPIVHDLEMYIDMTDVPAKLREYEGNELRKQVLYRAYCMNHNREEMKRISLEELIDYIYETDQCWEDDKYIIRECARLCGADKELLDRIDSYSKDDKEDEIKCPLCGEPLVHEEENGTHLYKCNQCPIVGMEFIEQKDINNMFKNLMKNYENVEEEVEEDYYE